MIMRRQQRLSPIPCAAVLAMGLLAQAKASPPPAPWAPHDIGTWEAPGSVDLDARGLWTVRATNGDVLQSADSLFFVCQPLSGDGSLVALLLGQEGGDPQLARAGLMLRESDAEGACNVTFGMTTGQGLSLTFRRNANQPSVDEGAGGRYGPRQFPTWLRLQREGDALTPFTSSDGYGWAQVHSPISLPGFSADALAGLAASSRFGGSMTAVFNNPTVAPGQLSPLVQACAGNGAVLLTWPPVSGAVAYRIRRSAPTTPGFPADLLTASPIAETSFADANLLNGRPLRYLVSPIFEQGGQRIEGWATAVTVTPVATPASLFGCNINLEATRLAGTVSYDPATNAYPISGSGSDIWDTEDHCFFASQWVKGDVQITARLLDKPGKRAGVMIRESLGAPARMVLLAGTAASGVVYQYRERIGGAAAWPGKPAIAAGDFTGTVTVRLVRRGATITPFLSLDGTTFTQAGPPRTFDPPLAESLYVGYAITSQNPGALGSSTFKDLSIGPP
jgi:hypothetical protein